MVTASAHAQDDVAAFYRGKQVRFVVGTAPGGLYDLAARIVARHMAAHIPGNPTIVVQNLPAAGGLVMANQLYAAGPKDGTVIGVPINGVPTMPLIQPAGVQFDANRLIWIGSTNREPYVAFVWHTAPVQRLEDLRTQELLVGSTTPGTTMSDFPAVTNRPRTEIPGGARLSGHAADQPRHRAWRDPGPGRHRLGGRQGAGAAVDCREEDQGDCAIRAEAER